MSEPNQPSQSCLEHFPVSFFAVVMGFAGLTLAVHKIEAEFDAVPIASTLALATTVLVFLIISGFYLAKQLRHPKAVLWEWQHPVRLAFFPAISVSLLLIATGTEPLFPDVAHVVWWVGIVLQLIATLAVVSAWIGHRPFETLHLNPAWFIPAVGNVLVPLVGTAHGYTEISWFFFATGMIFWVVLLTLVFNRLIFHAPLPERLTPTLMILIAPPAVGFLAYFCLEGEIDAMARVLYYGAVIFALVLATQFNRLRKLPFALSWWAFSFPLAALTVATFAYGKAIGSAGHTGAGFVLFALLVAVIALLVTKTVGALAAGKICVPEK